MALDAAGKMIRGRPKLRLLDLVREEMARNQMTPEMAQHRQY